jgi:hypothetical protein
VDEQLSAVSQGTGEARPAPAAESLLDLLAVRAGAVLLPWFASRLAIFVVAQHAAEVRDQPGGFAAFAVWDGLWYADISRLGYGFAHPTGETPYPFFPLLPALLHLGSAFGFSPIAFGVLLNHAIFLIALLGVYEITRARFGAASATFASWSLALYPGSTPLTMVYPSAIFLACAVWAFRSLEQDRDGRAALLAAIATLVRPNGLIVAIALAFASWMASRSWRRALAVALPAGICVAIWMGWLWTQTGDPLMFVHAKSAWRETTFATILGGRDPIPRIDGAPLVFVAVVLAFAGWRLPPAWLLFTALCVLPSLGLGILGMPRYTSVCFPLFSATGTLLARRGPLFRCAVLGFFAVVLLLFANRIFLLRNMP